MIKLRPDGGSDEKQSRSAAARSEKAMAACEMEAARYDI